MRKRNLLNAQTGRRPKKIGSPVRSQSSPWCRLTGAERDRDVAQWIEHLFSTYLTVGASVYGQEDAGSTPAAVPNQQTIVKHHGICRLTF